MRVNKTLAIGRYRFRLNLIGGFNGDRLKVRFGNRVFHFEAMKQEECTKCYTILFSIKVRC